MKKIIAWSYWTGWIGMTLAILMPIVFLTMGRNTPGIAVFFWFASILACVVSGVLLTKQSWWCPVFMIVGFGSLIFALSISAP